MAETHRDPLISEITPVEDYNIRIILELLIDFFLIIISDAYLGNEHRDGVSTCLPFVQ